MWVRTRETTRAYLEKFNKALEMVDTTSLWGFASDGREWDAADGMEGVCTHRRVDDARLGDNPPRCFRHYSDEGWYLLPGAITSMLGIGMKVGTPSVIGYIIPFPALLIVVLAWPLAVYEAFQYADPTVHGRSLKTSRSLEVLQNDRVRVYPQDRGREARG